MKMCVYSESQTLHQVCASCYCLFFHARKSLNNWLPCTYTHTPTCSPDEYPFSRDLPEPVLPRLDFPATLYPNKINANPSIYSFYTCAIVPRITRRATLALASKKRARGIIGSDEYEDDGNYGSAATIDVEVLQSISKRVHYGAFSISQSIIAQILVFLSPSPPTRQ
jgi:hypothetical protein